MLIKAAASDILKHQNFQNTHINYKRFTAEAMTYSIVSSGIHCFMKIIPVIDLKDGVVVHAQQGKREHYQPINTDLCQSSDIYQVIEAFLGVYDFDTIYIADLNAITDQGDHDHLITEVLTRFPHITFWIDRGYQRYDDR